MSKKNPLAFMDISIGSKPIGRVIFELFMDLTPKTAENFRGLCTGEYGNVGLQSNTKKLHYATSRFHRIVEDFMIQGGDITKGDGSGGFSIYGEQFMDEDFTRRHSCAGLLSMANCGRNSNNSQFFVTLKSCPHLDGKHVVFGQVTYGMEVVRAISKTVVDRNDKPRIAVVVTACGELGDTKSFFMHDPFNKEGLERIRQANEKNVLKFEENKEEKDGEPETEELEEDDPETIIREKLQDFQRDIDENDANNTEEDLLGKRAALPDDKKKRLLELKLKMNQARKGNLKAVYEEENRNSNPNYIRKLKEEKRSEYRKEADDDLKFKGITDQNYMNRPAAFLNKEKKKKAEVFGWDVFNDESLYKAYEKRCKDMPHYSELYSKQMAEPEKEHVIDDERKTKLVQDIERQQAKRKDFSRARMFDFDEEVTYINQQNRVFNKKLQRDYKDYTKEIKANIERGTALN